MTTAFTINWDYRCPFARNAHEHLVAALRAGAPYEVRFAAFSLDQVHVAEGEPSVWEQPDKRPTLTHGAAGIVVRDRLPEQFLEAHLALFAARHDLGGDLRQPEVVYEALKRAEVDADAVFAEIEAGWPYDVLRAEHEELVLDHHAFGVPTFILAGQAVFVRLMTRPAGDADTARATIDRVLQLVAGHPELNEFKHTSIPR